MQEDGISCRNCALNIVPLHVETSTRSLETHRGGDMSASTFHGRNELFQPVADALSLLVWIAGPDKLCTYFNKRWLEFTGRPIEAEIGDGWTRGVHREDLEQCMATFVGAFDRREPFVMEYRLRRHDGQYR